MRYILLFVLSFSAFAQSSERTTFRLDPQTGLIRASGLIHTNALSAEQTAALKAGRATVCSIWYERVPSIYYPDRLEVRRRTDCR